jgi:Uncharacterised protein family (UPF0158)
MTQTDDIRQVIWSLRGAAAPDRGQLLDLAQDAAVRPHLPEAGEALLVIAEGNAAICADAALTLAGHLAERGWAGDAELAELLLDVVEPSGPKRQRVRADLDGVADLLEGSLDMGFGGLLDFETGYTWPQAIIEDWGGDGEAPDADADPDRYLYVPNEGSREAWRDMRDFAADVQDPATRERLLDAIDGRGAFSRFRRVLDQHDDLRAAWYAYSTEARTGRAREWLAGEGYDALPARR